MVSFSNVFSGGWRDFTTNPVFIIPGILFSMVGTLFGFALLWSLFGDIGTVASLFLGTVDPFFFESIDFEALNLSLFGLTFLVGLVLTLICYSFIYAGLTGMAKEAALTGSTKLGDFFSYGVQYLLRVVCYMILLTAIFAIPTAAIFAAFAVLFLAAIAAGPAGIAIGMILGLLLLLVLIVVFIVLYLMTYFGTYAIVIDDMGVIDGLKTSYYLFMDNKANVFIFLLLIFAISIGIGFITFIISVILGFIPIAGPITALLIETIIYGILYALMFAWGVRMYYELTKEAEESVHDEYSEYASIEQGILENQPSSISKL